MGDASRSDSRSPGTILDLATALIVHSRYVERRARAAGYGGRLWRIPHPAWPMPHVAPARDVAGDPLVGCFGNLNMNKRIPQLLEAFALLLQRPARRAAAARGAAAERFDLEPALRAARPRRRRVIRRDYVPEERLWSLMAACDVLVNLRSPTMGETSGAVIRGLSLGKAMLVSDVGWFAELPDDVALKVPVDEYEVGDDRGGARARGRPRAPSWARRRASTFAREHDLDRAADALRRARSRRPRRAARPSRTRCSARIAEAAAEVGIEDVSELALRAREAGLVR